MWPSLKVTWRIHNYSSTLLLRLRFQGYCCELSMSFLWKWRVTWNYAHNPFYQIYLKCTASKWNIFKVFMSLNEMCTKYFLNLYYGPNSIILIQNQISKFNKILLNFCPNLYLFKNIYRSRIRLEVRELWSDTIKQIKRRHIYISRT